MARLSLKLCAVILLFTTFAAAEVTRYSGTLRLDPTAGRLSADLVVAVTARDKELAQDVFYLNKGLSIESVRCDRCSGHSFDVSKTNQVQFVQHGVPLTVTFKRPLKRERR